MDTQVASELARFVVQTRYSEIPDHIVKFAKGLVLKTVAGMLAGSIMPSGRKMSEIIKSRYLREETGVIGCGFRTPLWESIFLNTFLAHASELEDDSGHLGTFWDITVIPLLFPLAEKLRISGENLMEALVVGLEVHARTCLFSPQQLNVVVVPGAVGPAAAGARALGLDVEQTASAFGLAMSGPAISLLNTGTDAHYLESALQSLQGIMAAEMAKEGMSGNPSIPSYLIGLLGNEKVNPEKIVMDLGDEWLMSDIAIKKYPCCILTQRQIDIVLELKREHNLSFENLEKIEVHASPADAACDRPEPQTLGDLQFSFQHVLGAAMLDGDVNFSHIDLDTLADPRYNEARSRVEVKIYPDRSHIILEAPAQVNISMKDGKTFSGERMHMIGSREEPLTMDEFSGLYRKFTSGILSDDRVEKTLRSLLNLEKLNDVADLMNMLTYV